MAFQHPTALPRPTTLPTTPPQDQFPSFPVQQTSAIQDSQEWILFAPSQSDSLAHQTRTTTTAGLSRVSDLGSLNTAARSGRLESDILDDGTEDGELDSLDEGLHAFREPALVPTTSHQTTAPVLPTHDGLGTFPASSAGVQEQIWQYEQYNPKRKHEGNHRRTSSIQRRLDTIEEFDAQVNEEKRLRIEKWRMDQSQALLEEVERETRRRLRRESSRQGVSATAYRQQVEDILGTTPKQSDYQKEGDTAPESEPFWRRITRKFIRDVIGIDEPLLSVILGESLPEEPLDQPSPPPLATIAEQLATNSLAITDNSWRDRLLRRIAKELGVLVHQLSPHPGAFSTYLELTVDQDYAGIPIRSQINSSGGNRPASKTKDQMASQSIVNDPNFFPTAQDTAHAASWGVEDEPTPSTSSGHLQYSERLRQEREYWERELDVKMIFRFLKDRFSSQPTVEEVRSHRPQSTIAVDAAQRAAVIRQNHPLVSGAHRSQTRTHRDSRLARRPGSSCASESAKSSRKASIIRSAPSSRNYWDLGGSVGTGSLLASGSMMGAWGEV